MLASTTTTVLAVALAVSSGVQAARDRAEDAVLDPEDDAKCNEVVPGSSASRFGSVLGGLKECTCKDGEVIASKFGDLSLDTLGSSGGGEAFEYDKAMLISNRKCMTEKERDLRVARHSIDKAIEWKKDSTTGWAFLGVEFHGKALGETGNALGGADREIFTTDFYFKFDCAGRSPRAPELDGTCEHGMAAFKTAQSEARACLDAMRGLERAKGYLESGAYNKAVGLLAEATKALRESGRDTAKAKALEARAALLDLVQAISSKVEVPPF